MPSSMIFASLVVLWLLILVPAVAGHRQEVARPSVAALSGRVLTRPPRRQSQEVEGMGEREGDDETRDGRVLAARAREVRVPRARAELRPDEIGAAPDDVDQVEDAPEEPYDADWAEDDEAAEDAGDHTWERPPPRYRAGRGGFDAEAAALAAKARYTFRQRVVLLMLVAALATGIVAAVAVRSVWWAHGTIDVLLVGYLVYLRRQVRLEEAIRARRAARMAGTRRQSAAEDPELDEWAERGREAVRSSEPAEDIAATTRPRWSEMPSEDRADDAAEGRGESVDARQAAEATPACASVPSPPVVAAPVVEEEPRALPRLHPTPPPPLPPGTTLVEDADDELDLDDSGTPGYRRAVGQ